jgi:hypothetical protein
MIECAVYKLMGVPAGGHLTLQACSDSSSQVFKQYPLTIIFHATTHDMTVCSLSCVCVEVFCMALTIHTLAHGKAFCDRLHERGRKPCKRSVAERR